MGIKTTALRALGLTAALAVLALPAFAGGPLAVCECGTPYLWPNGGQDIPFNPDQGDLAILDNADAVQFVIDSFQAWEDVATSTASYSNEGALPVDVDDTNFAPFLFPGVADGFSPIVFDDDGAIFDLLFGPGSGVLGFAGPDVVDPESCEILEGAAFLNGPSFGDLELAANVMVHEFGHYSNLAHTVVNGQILISASEGSGPGSDIGTFGLPSFVFPNETVETMYPFLFIGIDQLSRTPHADDIAILSTLYPEPSFFATTGTISGSILGGNGTTLITGVNVIARNFADPFFDAVSAISSDFTNDFSGCCPVAGTYTINGLTPGAEYGVFVDGILAGGFSTPPASPLPGPEEFYNGAGETGSVTDPVLDFTKIVPAAGSPATGIDILFNQPDPGTALPVGDDGTVQIFLPFEFCYTGQPYESVFINANGNLTFGSQDTTFFNWIESAAGHLDGPPRIAGLWDDLSPNAGGSVSYSQTSSSFTVSWADVPEFPASGSNSFDITLQDNGDDCELVCGDGDSDSDSDFEGESDSDDDDVIITYGDLTATDGLAGVSAGLFATNGVEPEIDLSVFAAQDKKIKLKNEAAGYELFLTGENDLANSTNRYRVGKRFQDDFEKNNSRKKAKVVEAPFNTIDTENSFSAILPAAGDVDYYKFEGLEAGKALVAEVLRGQLDSVIGVFDADGNLLNNPVADDDAGSGLLSKSAVFLPADGDYFVAVSFCCDYDLDGVDPGQGGPLDLGRYILSVEVLDGLPLTLGDDNFVQVGFGFDFPFQGTNYNDVFVNANGNLTFGSEDTTFFNWEETVADFLAGPPRISPLWDDLSPNAGGTVLFQQGTGCVKISFTDVPEFPGTGANTFSATFDASGNIQFDYGALTALDGLVGITEGGGAADPGESDVGGGTFSAVGTTYENFDGNDNDLSGATVVFGSPTSCD